MKWFKEHKVATVILVLVVLIIIGAGASNGKGNTSVNTKASSSSTSHKAAATNTTAHVGSALAIGGSKGLAVTVKQIVDPASGGDEFTTPAAGKRFVAVLLSIKNNGSGAYQDDANNNLSIKGSDNQNYTPSFDTLSGCTNFNNGEYTLTAGDSVDGCVSFQVPNGVTVSKIQFQTISGFASSTGEWINP